MTDEILPTTVDGDPKTPMLTRPGRMAGQEPRTRAPPESRPCRSAQTDAASQTNPSGSLKDPASLTITIRCDPLPSGETRRPWREHGAIFMLVRPTEEESPVAVPTTT
jgi:hypothetical protein